MPKAFSGCNNDSTLGETTVTQWSVKTESDDCCFQWEFWFRGGGLTGAVRDPPPTPPLTGDLIAFMWALVLDYFRTWADVPPLFLSKMLIIIFSSIHWESWCSNVAGNRRYTIDQLNHFFMLKMWLFNFTEATISPQNQIYHDKFTVDLSTMNLKSHTENRTVWGLVFFKKSRLFPCSHINHIVLKVLAYRPEWGNKNCGFTCLRNMSFCTWITNLF